MRIRPFEPGDEANVLTLLGATLGGGPAGRRPAGFFRWKHFKNPFGPSFLLVAEVGEQIIGLRAFMRWRFEAAGHPITAVRAVDTATHPDYQGRGIFSRLTREALEQLQGRVDLVFNTPNGASRPGYLKLGWEEVGRVPVAVRIRRPLSFGRGLRGTEVRSSPRPEIQAVPAAQVLAQPGIAELLADTATGDGRLRTHRDVEYLRWRYGAAPLLGYVAISEEQAGALRGIAVFRLRPRRGLWEATVAEVLVPPGDRRTARRLLRRIARTAPVDHLTLHPGMLGAGVAARSGFLPAPGGICLVVRPLRHAINPNPARLDAWSFSLGDLEVF
jgi:GNAT superfamily N-acetyltransferase